MQSGFRFFVVKKIPKIGYDPMVLEYQYGIKKGSIVSTWQTLSQDPSYWY